MNILNECALWLILYFIIGFMAGAIVVRATHRQSFGFRRERKEPELGVLFMFGWPVAIPLIIMYLIFERIIDYENLIPK